MSEVKNSSEQEIGNAQPNPSASLGDLPSSKDSMEEVNNYANPTEQGLVVAPTKESDQMEQVMTMTAQFLRSNALVKEILDESDRKSALDILTSSGYIDQDGHVTDKLSKKVAKLGKKAGKDACCRIRIQYLYSQLVKAGYKFVVIEGNREIDSNNVDTLKEDVLKSKKKCFEEAGKVVQAECLLDEGYKLYDLQNNPVTKDTPDLDMYLAIIDCQHRVAACAEDPTIDLFLEIAEYDSSTADYINRLNNTRKAWTGNDIKHSVRVKHQGHVNTLDEIERFKKYFCVTDKYAECALTGKVDQFRKDELIRIQIGKFDPSSLPLKYMVDQNNVDTAYNIMYATKCAFNKEKSVNKLEYIDAVINIKGYFVGDQEKTFNRDITCFIAKIDNVEASKIIAKIKAGDTESLKKYLWKQYQSFCSDHKEDMDILYKEVAEAIEAKKSEMENPGLSAKTKKLRIGSMGDVLANRKKIAEEKAARESKAASKEVSETTATKELKAVEAPEKAVPDAETPEVTKTGVQED